MEARQTENASVTKTMEGFRLAVHGSKDRTYRDAQLDDYSGLSRRNFPHRSLTLSLRVRASGSSIPGTWGFGLWNDPFGMSLGFGETPFRLPALPNAVWFFHASKENHLSFQDAKPANGFLAQAFCSPRFHPLLIPAGIALPFARASTRRMLGKVINEASLALSVDVANWHDYRLEWRANRCAFWVDQAPVFESSVSPNPPLGVIIWIDNQYAAFTPEGKIAWGVLEGREEWLEIKNLEIKKSPE